MQRGSNHRSVQGLVICYAGVPVAWQCNQQPFVTHSTAEAELVSYCEALLAGRASEALLCAIWGEDLNANTFERVMYGDNAAAIGLAHGVTAASWRTRHLRIRSSILKEALQESSDVPGGQWQLIHLKGHRISGRWMHEAFEWTGLLQIFGGFGPEARCQSRSWRDDIDWRRSDDRWWRWFCSREGAGHWEAL